MNWCNNKRIGRIKFSGSVFSVIATERYWIGKYCILLVAYVHLTYYFDSVIYVWSSICDMEIIK